MQTTPQGYFIHKVALWLLHCIDFLIDSIFGYSLIYGSRHERKEAEEKYEKSAHVVSVLWKAANLKGYIKHLDNFFYIHKSYVNPDCVLNMKTAILYGHNKTHCFFVCTKREVDVIDSPKYNLMGPALFIHATGLIIIPHKFLNKLTLGMEDTSKKCIVGMVHNVQRCGSTLLAQIFKAIPNVRALSEPFALTLLHLMYVNDQISWDKFNDLFVQTVKLLIKCENGNYPSHIIIKLSKASSVAIKMYKVHFPNFIHIFNGREIKPQMESRLRMLKSFPTLNRYLGFFMQDVAKSAPYPYDDPKGHKIIWQQLQNLRGVSEEDICIINSTSLAAVYYTARKYRQHFETGKVLVIIFAIVRTY